MQTEIAQDGTDDLQALAQNIKSYLTGYNTAIALLIVIVSVALRLKHAGHILSWDDADNILQIKRLLAGRSLGDIELKHPPAFILLGAAVTWIFGFKAIFLIYLNILLSAASIFLAFLIAKKWFGAKFALAGAAFLAIMPNSVFFSTWIKQDMLLIILSLSVIYLWQNNRFILAGVALGAALLTKENAVIVLPVLLLDTILRKDRRSMIGFLTIAGVATLVSGWWYVLYMPAIISSSKGEYLNIAGLLSGAGRFGNPSASFYLTRLGLDISYAMIPLILIGLASKDTWFDEKKRLFALWLVLGYGISSIAGAKAPWYITPYMLPAAIIAARGLKTIANRFTGDAGLWVAVCVILLSGIQVYSYSYEAYSLRSNYDPYLSDVFRTAGRTLHMAMQPGERIAVPFEQELLAYYASLEDTQIFILPQDSFDIKDFIKENRIDYAVMYYSSSFMSKATFSGQMEALDKLAADSGWANIWDDVFIIKTSKIWDLSKDNYARTDIADVKRPKKYSQ